MKRIISILMVLSIMLLSVGTALAFSTSVTNGLNIAAVEDENGLITVTVSANDTTAIQGATVYLVLSGVKAVNATDKATEVTAAKDACVVSADLSDWSITTNTYTSGSDFKIVVGSSTAKVLTNQEIFKAYFVKSDSAATLSSTAFTLGTSTKTTSKLNYTAGVTKQSKTAADQVYFGISVTPYVAQGGGNTGWTETDGETTVTVKFPTSAAEKAGDASSWTGNASTQASKKAVKFGKNETGAKMLGATVSDGKLVVNNPEYYVEYNGEKYYGLIDVEAGKSWAILIIESAN